MGKAVAIVIAASLLASSALAQTQRGRGAAPPSGAPQVPAGRPTAPPPALVGPTLAEANRALAAAVAYLDKIGVSESCAVVDAHGDVVALHRMDRARFYLNDIARGKALASAMFGLPGSKMGAIANAPWFQNLNATAHARVGPGQGGLPIFRNDEIYGAIGCSGGTGQQDEEAAQAGLDTFH